jgi:hypothetical protein
VPLNVVVAPLGQLTCRWQRFVHAPGPQTFGVPPLPHGMPSGHVAPQSSSPPHPFPIFPQYWPPVAGAHATGVVQRAPDAPHTWSRPPPPQVHPLGQGALQSSVPPHPSPISPQYWPPGTMHEVMGLHEPSRPLSGRPPAAVPPPTPMMIMPPAPVGPGMLASTPAPPAP